MIKVFLENGDIIECQDNISGIMSIIHEARTAKNIFFGLVKTDGEGVIIPANRIMRIEGQLEKMPDDAEVTDVYDNPITRVGFEPDEENPEKTNVWLDTNFEYEIKI